jgi:hypothetical protein
MRGQAGFWDIDERYRCTEGCVVGLRPRATQGRGLRTAVTVVLLLGAVVDPAGAGARSRPGA